MKGAKFKVSIRQFFKTCFLCAGSLQSHRSVFALLLPDRVYLDASGGITFVSEGCPSV